MQSHIQSQQPFTLSFNSSHRSASIFLFSQTFFRFSDFLLGLFIMRYLLATATVLQAYLSLADDSGLGNYYAPGRAERMFEKRAGRDFGTFQVDCKNSESACNNACYYIRCQVYYDCGITVLIKYCG